MEKVALQRDRGWAGEKVVRSGDSSRPSWNNIYERAQKDHLWLLAVALLDSLFEHLRSRSFRVSGLQAVDLSAPKRGFRYLLSHQLRSHEVVKDKTWREL